MKQTNIYTVGTDVVISGDKFIIDMIKNENADKLLAEAFASVSGKVLNIYFKEASSDNASESQISLIDEL